MITEDYVSFETAKLLKEKGFNEECFAFYNPNGTLIQSNVRFNNIQVGRVEGSYSAPTHQMAMKWLREKGIYITIVYGDYPSLNKVFWTPQIDSLEGFDLPDSFYKEYDTYEEAVEAACLYVLNNLI